MALKIKTLAGLVNAALHIKTAGGIVPVNLHAKTADGIVLLLSGGASPTPLVPFDFDRLVTMGDSITNHLGDTTSERLTLQRYVSLTYGKTITYQNEAVSGSKAADALAKLPTVLASLPGGETVLFYVNTGFNDCSALQPYSDADSPDLEQLDEDYRALIQGIKTAGHKVIVGSVHFGTYGVNTGSPNYYDNPERGSLPFNDAIFFPAIFDLSPESMNADGRPIIDMYRLDYNDFPVLARLDGIHYQLMPQVYQRYWIIDRVMTWAAGTRPAPIAQSTTDPRTKTYQPERILISLDDPDLSTHPSPSAIRGWNAFYRTMPHNVSTLLDVDGNPSGITFAWPASGLVSATNGYGTSSTTPTLDVLTPSATKQSWYASGAGTFTLTLGGFNAGQSVDLRMVSSRASSTAYTTKLTVNSVDHEILSSSTTTAPYIDVSTTADGSGNIAIVVAAASGSSLGYLNAIEITPVWS